MSRRWAGGFASHRCSLAWLELAYFVRTGISLGTHGWDELRSVYCGRWHGSGASHIGEVRGREWLIAPSGKASNVGGAKFSALVARMTDLIDHVNRLCYGGIARLFDRTNASTLGQFLPGFSNRRAMSGF